MEAKGLVIGGLLPALMYGLAGLLQKATTKAGAGLGPYLLCIGLGVLAIGGVLTLTSSGAARAITGKAALLSMAMGLAWALGTWLVAIGISRYAAPLAKVVPLYNMNTLIVVVLALVIFAESRDVAVSKLLAGALLIVVGGTLVAGA
jgi:transporter family protein